MTRLLVPPLLALLVAAACTSGNGGDAPSASAPVPSEIQTGTVGVDGGSLYYETAGSGAPVILIHGGFGDRRMWDEQFGPLSQVFRVIRYDHRGFGRSSAPAAAYSPVGDLVKLMDHLKLVRANLVGNSMGGTLALDFALLQPDRTGAVVVIASTASGYPVPQEDVKRVEAVFEMARAKGTEAAAAQWLQHPMVAVAMQHPKAAPLVRQMIDENQKAFLMEHWPEERLTPPAYERLAGLNANVLLMVGDRDVAAVRDGARASADRIKRATFETIAGADHLPQMEQPAAVNKQLVQYISLNGC
jgi:pimeloyl-ACP methyl ester carboxylesterase